MLTGSALFARETMSETLAAVLRDAPAFEQLPADVPLPVRALLRRCLERDPKQRLRDIGEARIVLSAPMEQFHDRPAPIRTSRLWPTIATVAAVLALIAFGVAWWMSRETPLPVKRLDLPTEIGTRTFALSPDGQRVAYLSAGHLFVRAFDALNPVDLATVPPDVGALTWSPDGSTVTFAGGSAIQSVPAAGGPLFTLCRVPGSGRVMGMTWVPTTSSIAFSVWRDSLYTVPGAGGTPSVLVALNPQTEVDFHAVNSLPDGRLIVDTHQRVSDVSIVELIDGSHRKTLSSGSKIVGVAISGNRALFLRAEVNPGLWTAPFRNDTVDFSHAMLIQPDVVAYDLSLNGSVVVQLPAVSAHELESVDAKGGTTALPGPPIEEPVAPALAVSPDGRRVAYVGGPAVANLYVRDLESGRETQLTFSRSDDPSMGNWRYLRPSWFPASDRIMQGAGTVADEHLVARRADAAGDPQTLTSGIYGAVSSDGRTLVYVTDERGRHRLMRATFRPDGSLDPAQPVFTGESAPDVLDLALSPDGRLLAYAATGGNGRLNVYVTDFPAAQARLLVDNGGSRPRFARTGNELFYLEGNRDADGRTFGALMSVRIEAGPPMALQTPVRLFDDRSGGLELATYDVARDGRFVIAKQLPPPPGKGERVVLIENWPSLIRH
jgi:serine/threonine-protein kinase